MLALHDARMQVANGNQPFDTWPEDFTASIPDWRALTELSSEIRRQLEQTDEDYVEKVGRQVLLRMIDYVRRRRDPHSEAGEQGFLRFSVAEEAIMRRL